METVITPEEYVERKNDILNRCLRLTEEIYSNLEKWETLDLLFEKRMDIIGELGDLEVSAGDRITKTCIEHAAAQLDDKLRLILNLDKQIGQAISETQAELLASMKSNTQEQKFMIYEANQSPSSGVYLDAKK
jgi:CRP-like cAMP-binding protein